MLDAAKADPQMFLQGGGGSKAQAKEQPLGPLPSNAPMDAITASLQAQAGRGSPPSLLERRQAMLEKRRSMLRT